MDKREIERERKRERGGMREIETMSKLNSKRGCKKIERLRE